MNIQVEKEDINLIGHTSFNEKGFLAIIISVTDSGIKKILLRNILKCFGEEYKIVKFNEIWEKKNNVMNVTNIIISTNLPFSLYPQSHPFEDVELTMSTTLP